MASIDAIYEMMARTNLGLDNDDLILAEDERAVLFVVLKPFDQWKRLHTVADTIVGMGVIAKCMQIKPTAERATVEACAALAGGPQEIAKALLAAELIEVAYTPGEPTDEDWFDVGVRIDG